MHLVVLVTTSSVKEAEQIAQELLEKRLAACINIIPCVHSKFWGKETIEHCDEALMIIKSRSDVFDELAESVRAIHSYQIPEICMHARSAWLNRIPRLDRSDHT